MITVNKNELTLENVKKSNYWDLIALIVWGHYTDQKFQEDSKITISEKWYGVGECGANSYHTDEWNNPDFKKDGFVRTLQSIKIHFERNDYNTHIGLDLSGTINYFALSNETHKTVNLQNYNSLAITNWMLENNFFEIKE